MEYMSNISFQSDNELVEISGRERARMGMLVDDLAWTMHKQGSRSIPDPREENKQKLRWVYGNGFDDREDSLTERLGWVSLIGNDALTLLAHIHGQCEIHGWVHPDDKEWFANLIEDALKKGLLVDYDHPFYGNWAEVIELVRETATPIVSSYSVCEGWPDPYLIAEHRPDLFDWDDPLDYDDPDVYEESPYARWSALPEKEASRIAREALPDCAPQWHPEEWGIWKDLVMEGK